MKLYLAVVWFCSCCFRMPPRRGERKRYRCIGIYLGRMTGEYCKENGTAWCCHCRRKVITTYRHLMMMVVLMMIVIVHCLILVCTNLLDYNSLYCGVFVIRAICSLSQKSCCCNIHDSIDSSTDTVLVWIIEVIAMNGWCITCWRTLDIRTVSVIHFCIHSTLILFMCTTSSKCHHNIPCHHDDLHNIHQSSTWPSTSFPRSTDPTTHKDGVFFSFSRSTSFNCFSWVDGRSKLHHIPKVSESFNLSSIGNCCFIESFFWLADR